MNMLLCVLAITFTAFCVWLTVRIVNRRERWANWTAATLFGLPVLYVASFGPACWFATKSDGPMVNGEAPRKVSSFYKPLGWTMIKGPKPIANVVKRYATLRTQYVIVPADWNGNGQLAVALRQF